MAAIELRNLTKQYGGTLAVDRLDASIRSGELFFLVGPSGCGKSTALRMIAGLTEPSAGQVFIDGRDVTRLPARERNTTMVFQGYALWPHMTVAENVAFGLEARGVKGAERKERVERVLEVVRIPHLADRRPARLSGGEQQRVALARAMVVSPAVLLLDEPLSNLDANLRLELRKEVKRICLSAGITAVYVTHDQGEALSMADRIAVMNRGRLSQVGTPRELYDRPSSRFVAGFLGPANFLSGVVSERNGEHAVVTTPAGALRSSVVGEGTPVGGAATCSIRPENFRMLGDRETAENVLTGRIVETMYLGLMTEYVVELSDGVRVTAVDLQVERPREVGETLRLGCRARDAVLLTA